MAQPITEINIFETNEVFRGHPEILGRPLALLNEAGAEVMPFSGLEAEDPNVGFIVVNWKSYERKQEVMKQPIHAEYVKGVTAAVASPPKVYHVQFSAPPFGLEKPVTEIVLITLKNPANRAALGDILTTVSEISDNQFVHGQTREDGNKFIAVYGWESVEAHKQARLRPEASDILGKLHALGEDDYIVYHAALKKF